VTQKTLAERCYDAFIASLDWPDAPAFHDLEDKGAAWCRVANARDELLEPPEVSTPYEYELTEPVIRRYTSDGTLVKERLPASLPIRPLVAGDLCHPECSVGGVLFRHTIQAGVHGIKRTLLEKQIDPVDADVAEGLVGRASGEDADARVEEIHGGWFDGFTIAALTVAWGEVCNVLLIEDCGKHMLVQCRTPGLGTIKVGPYLLEQKRVHRDTASTSNEWDGRLAALALASSKPQAEGRTVQVSVSELKSARIEDVQRIWHAFELLKKKASEMSTLIALRQLSATSSPQSASETSTGGPSKS
jgi:hypothetical protein